MIKRENSTYAFYLVLYKIVEKIYNNYKIKEVILMENKKEKLTAEQTLLKALKNPFDPKFVKYRVGATSKDKKKGIALFYIDSREVQKRLDDVCGIDGWQCKMTPSEKGVICELSIRMPNGTWITKTDGGEYTEKVTPFKGGCSDALKRAAVQFGIGRYLYYIPNKWYPLNEYKTFETIPELPDFANPYKVDDWEEVAIKQYCQTDDVNLDNVDFTDYEAEQILTTSSSRKAELIAKMKAKKQ